MTRVVADVFRRRPQLSAHLVLALGIYPALLATQRGRVVADTKQYLTLDPATMLRASTSLWDPDWALGTVTHQSIGYLWPMGPWFAGADALGIPMWVTQRLWIGTILFAAGAGILFLGRVLGWSAKASFAAGAFYALSPYALTYATRISALILPWAALPWLLGLAIRSLRDAEAAGTGRLARWRDPARFALVTVTVGSVNASSLLYVGLAIVAWFPFAVWVVREAHWRPALATVGRIGVCTSVVSAWWAVALVVQGRWGPDVLAFSETLEVVASGSPASEAWRSLGYWVFYGGDRTGPWVSAGETYTENVAVLAVTFGLSILALGALLVVRWRYRAYCLGLAIAGLVLTIGLYPYDDPSPLGALISGGAAESTLALALRSSPRAMPLFLLAVACSFAVGIDALSERADARAGAPWWRRRPGTVAAGAVVGVAVLALPPLWQLRYVGDELARDETLPEPWREAAAYLDTGDPNDRILILPGGDFSAHRWGNTIDHVLPGIVERPVAVRELIPYGGSAAADVLIALDRRAQERLLEPAQVVPIARLLGVGDVIAQFDQEFERYRTPRPDDLWRVLSDRAAGFASTVPFGPPTENEASAAFPMVDEVDFDLAPDLPHPPPVAALGIPDPLGVLRTRPASAPLLVVGDGESLLEMAGAGVLDTDRLVLYAAALTDDQIADALAAGASVVITDGNRDRARRWKTVRDNLGITEARTGDGLDPDPTDTRLDVFPGAAADAFATTIQRDVLARSSSYGNPISFHPEDRAFHAVDGDPTTAWRAGTFTDARREWLDLTWTDPQPASTLTVVQPLTLLPNRWITELAISIDGGPRRVVTLDERSRTTEGQTIDLEATPVVEHLRLTVVETNAGDRPGYGGLSGIGFAEVFLDDDRGPGTELVATPTELADDAIAGTFRIGDDNAVTIVLARERVDDSSPARDDPETAIRRHVTLPTSATFTVGGTARLTGRADDRAIDTALRTLAGQDDDVTPFAVAEERLPGDATHRASTLVDGDPDTVYRPPIGPQVGRTVTVHLGETQTVDELTFTVVADGRHSVPLAFDVTGDDGEVRRAVLEIDGVDVDGDDEGATVTRRAGFEPITTSTLRLTVAETRPVIRTDWYAARPVEQPIGIATVDIPGVAPRPLPATVDSSCRDDLVRIDGRSVPVRLVGTLPDGDDRAPLTVIGCDLVTLDEGAHDVVTAPRDIGITIDRLVLDRATTAPAPPPPPAMDVLDRGRGTYTVTVDAADDAYWLVLGESFSEGWRATVRNGPDLGPPTLVDGFANGWHIDPAEVAAGGPLVVELVWTPNRTVRAGLGFSGLGVLVVIGLALGRRPRQRSTAVAGTVGVPDAAPTRTGAWTPGTVGVTVLAAAAAGAATRPILGVGFLVGVVAAQRWRHGRRAVAAVAVASLAAAGAYVVIQQLRFSPPHDGAWPSLWDRAHLLGWAAIVALGVEWLVSLRATRAASPARRAPQTKVRS